MLGIGDGWICPAAEDFSCVVRSELTRMVDLYKDNGKIPLFFRNFRNVGGDFWAKTRN